MGKRTTANIVADLRMWDNAVMREAADRLEGQAYVLVRVTQAANDSDIDRICALIQRGVRKRSRHQEHQP
jgi:hypothetical protein